MNTTSSVTPSSAMSSPTLTMLQPNVISTIRNQELATTTQERFNQFLNNKVDVVDYNYKMDMMSPSSPTPTKSLSSYSNYYVNRTPQATSSPCLKKKKIQMSDKLESHLRQLGFVWNNNESIDGTVNNIGNRRSSKSPNSFLSSCGSTSSSSSSASSCSSWEDYFLQLLKYQKLHGHCNVPGYYPKNQHLSNFVKLCRLQYRQMLLRGRHSIVDKMHTTTTTTHTTTSSSSSASNTSSSSNNSNYSSTSSLFPRKYPTSTRRGSNGSKLTSSNTTRRRELVLTLDRIAKLERIGFEWDE